MARRLVVLLALALLPLPATADATVLASDAPGDVARPPAPQLPAETPAELPLLPLDLTSLSVVQETPTDFVVAVQLAAPPALEGHPIPVETWTRFEIRGTPYALRSVIRSITTDQIQLAAEHELRIGSAAIPLQGALDGSQILVTVPKSQVGSPAEGDLLSKPVAMTRYGSAGPAWDVMPDQALATAPDPGSASVLLDRFGSDYLFGQYPQEGTANLQVSAAPQSLELTQGQTAILALQIANRGAAQDTAQITISAQGPVATAFADGSSRSLNPNDQASVLIRVTATAGGAGVVNVLVTSANGARVELLVPVLANAAPAAPTPPAPPPPAPPEPAPPPAEDTTDDEEEGRDTPLPILAALAGMVLAARRRRRN